MIGPSAAVNASYGLAQMSLTRENWPVNPALVTMIFEASTDGGVVWREFGRATMSGGTVNDPNGQLLTVSRIRIGLPDTGNPARQLRATMINTQTMRTAVTLEAE